MLVLPLNGSLAGTDRNGAMTATGSGALRWAAAPGGRTNQSVNSRFATNTNGWSSNGGVGASITRIADGRFAGGTACRVVAPGDTNYRGIVQTASGVPNNIETGVITVSFDIIVESGRYQNLQLGVVSWAASGAFVYSPNAVFSVSGYDVLERVSKTLAPVAQFYDGSRMGSFVWNGAAEASQFIISNVVVEYGTVPNPTYFDGDTGVWLYPRTGALGTAHASPSVEHAVAWVEEGTSNLVPNPWRATNNTGWAALNGSTARTTVYAYQGPGAGLLTATAANAEEQISITAAASSHTAQAIVRNPNAATRQCQLTYNGALIGSATNVAAGATATITAAFTGTGGAANLGVRWIDSVNTETFVTCYLGAEAKAYATSPCPAIDSAGTVITGYSWAGTAHASVSTRTQTTTSVDVTNDDRIDTAQGAMVARYRLGVLADHHQAVVHHGIFSGANDSIGIENHTGGQARAVAWRGGPTKVANGGAVPAVGVDSILWGEWDSSTLYAQQDSSPLVTASANTPSGVPSSSSLYIGGGSLANRELNGYIGPVAIYDAPLSDARRALVNTAIDNGNDLWSLFAGNPYTFFQLRPY